MLTNVYFEKYVTIKYKLFYTNYTESAKTQILELNISHYISTFNVNETRRKHNL